MRKSLRLIVSTLVALLMCVTMLSPTALAVENPALEIAAAVTVSGAVPDIADTFSIKLSADDLSNPMPEGSLNGVSTMMINGAGSVTFPKIYFAKIGIHDYTIWQEPGSNIDCTYDMSVYHMKVFVTNAETGGLEITTVIYKNDETEKSPAIVFDNLYTKPDPVTHDPPVEKLVVGAGAPSDAKFSFQMKAITPAAPMPEGSVNGLMTRTIMGAGSFEFGEMEFEEIGTYVYELRELPTDAKNFTFDPTLYTITVKITREGSKLVKEVIYTKNNGTEPLEKLVYSNTYKAPPPPIPRTGESTTALPILGAAMVLGGVGLTVKKKKSK